MMKRNLPVVVALLVALALATGCASTNEQAASTDAISASAAASNSSTTSQDVSSSATQQEKRPIIGIDWRPDQSSLSYVSTCRTLDALGYDYVLLGQVHSADFAYDSDGKLLEGVAETGALTPEAAKLVRCNTWEGSDVEEVLGEVSAVIFAGGEDVSPSLYYHPQEWHGIEAERAYSAERDVSDFLLMDYCLDHDIPFMSICRGTQMLSVVSGAEMVQDIGTWFAAEGLEYENGHKQLPDENGNRDMAPNDVTVKENTLLYSVVQRSDLEGCPCWHHQMIGSVDGTRLIVSATADTQGVQVIEGVERTDQTYAVGVQFHPEMSVVKTLDNAENRDDYLDYDTALSLFERLEVEAEAQLEETESLPAAA